MVNKQAQASVGVPPPACKEPGTVCLSESEPATTKIVGGTTVKQCQFPSTVALAGGCTATLVHPKLVITAAHCIPGSGPKHITFGENWSEAKIQAPVAKCGVHKQWEGLSTFGKGVDFAYCLLEEEVTTVPIVPILMGCEVDVLKPGTPVVIAGFGAEKAPEGKPQGGGPKRYVETEFVKFVDGINKQAIVGRKNAQGCMGDSGGPVFVKLPEDKFNQGAGWRVFGVTSGEYEGPGDCTGGQGQYGMMHLWVEDLEKETGLDITPCFDGDGTWNPGPDCRRAPLDLVGTAQGSWPSCDPGPLGALITSCGAQEDAENNEEEDESCENASEDSESPDESEEESPNEGEKSSTSPETKNDSAEDSDNSDGSGSSGGSSGAGCGTPASAASRGRSDAWLTLVIPGLLACGRRRTRD